MKTKDLVFVIFIFAKYSDAYEKKSIYILLVR